MSVVRLNFLKRYKGNINAHEVFDEIPLVFYLFLTFIMTMKVTYFVPFEWKLYLYIMGFPSSSMEEVRAYINFTFLEIFKYSTILES